MSATCPGSPAGTGSPPTTAPRRSRCPPATARTRRLSRRGNRRLNHAVHMAAVTQASHRSSDGRAYYDKKIAEGKTAKEALRALKRQVSDAIYKHLKADAARTQAASRAREGTRGTTLSPARPAHTPNASSSAKPLPDLPLLYGPRFTSGKSQPHTPEQRPREPLDAKRHRSVSIVCPNSRQQARHRTSIYVTREGQAGGSFRRPGRGPDRS